MPELKIDQEFQALCPPLQAEEREQLEASLLAEGCREPLCVYVEKQEAYCETCAIEASIDYRWDHHPYGQEGEGREGFWLCRQCGEPIDEEAFTTIVLDGHNRYAICLLHQIPFETRYLWQITSREEAVNWIIANQLGRRNLTPEQKSYLRGKRCHAERRQDAGHGNQKSGIENQEPIHTKLASEYHVSPSTIYADSQFATAVDTLESQVRQDIRDTILRRQDREQGKITKQQAMQAGKLVQAHTVEPQPFMRRPDWKPYQVLEAIAIIGDMPKDESHTPINAMLDQPFIPPITGLAALKKLKAMSPVHRQRIYALALSSDARDRSDAITLTMEIPPEPDKQVIIAQHLIRAMEDLRSQQRRNWRREFPEEPWIGDLDIIDALMVDIQKRWRDIEARVKTSHAERIARYAITP